MPVNGTDEARPIADLSAKVPCVMCSVAAPCPEANEAAQFLVDRGLLLSTSPERKPAPTGQSLVTYVWQWWFERLPRSH
jgi:hypothetical protein